MSQKDEFHNLDNPADGLFRELASGVTTRIFSGEHAMLSVVTLAPHAQGTLHHHPEEQWGVLLDGSAIRVQGDEEIPVKKGDFWRTPGNVPHTMRAGPDGARVLDIFSPPRPEYKKAGSGFGTFLRIKQKKRSRNREETLGEDYQTQLACGVGRVRGDAGAGAAGKEHDAGGAVPAGRLHRRAGAAIAVSSADEAWPHRTGGE